MKFSEMPYARPDMDSLFKQLDNLTAQLQDAPDAQAQLEIFDAKDKLMSRFNTLSSICSIRNTVDTRDKFYEEEQEYLDGQYPLVSEKVQAFNKVLVTSPFRRELEEKLGALLFTNIELELKSFSPEIVPLLQEENRLSTEYQKLYASARIEFMGKTVTIAQLGPYKQDPDRTVRKAAIEAEGGFFDQHRQELDELYDKLVKNRTEQAKKLGFENYVPLGFIRMGRNCYTPEDLSSFRSQVVRDLVPLTVKVKARQAKRLGIDDFKFYDNTFMFKGGSAKPQGTPEEIMAAGRRMYHELSEETGEFIDLMLENELFDVLAKEGKAPGGYCTSLPDYKYPFIFSNFNGTSGDVDVLTHEAGHAFADFRAQRRDLLSALESPTMEGCETHSMSMEFFAEPWYKEFFGPLTRKYEVGHCESSLIFIPYGCMVDEFQHIVYENPDMTPAQRNEAWMGLERKYRPWEDFEDLPFYGRGAGWQRQLHIYGSPFYYLDYCMAQTVAFQFWLASLKDREDAWARYLRFVDAGGTMSFAELVTAAGLKVPYAPGCVKEIGDAISAWIDANPL